MLTVTEPFGIDAFKILQYGVSGFAVVLLYLGYRLLHQLIDIPDSKSNIKPKLTAVIIFMATSLIFFFGGIISEYFRDIRENPVYVLITPEKMPEGVNLPKIRHGLEAVEFKDKGAKISLKYNDYLTVQLDCLTDQIIQLKATMPHVAELNSSLQQ